jgi:GH24 family phage-related lysozyme (muramidase)
MISSGTALDPRIDPRLARDIDAAEGDRLAAYQDTLGNWTIGRGHLLAGSNWAGFTISQSASDKFFSVDILQAMGLASKWAELEKCDTDCRKNALYEIAFNMANKWDQFVHARAAIQAGDWQQVHDQLLNSLWAKQVHGRATRIANYFLTGEYPNVAGNN